jgi:hypothetical protein
MYSKPSLVRTKGRNTESAQRTDLIPYTDSRLDLLERQLRVSSNKLKQAATELLPKGLRTPRTPGAQTPVPLENEDAEDAEKRDKDKWRSRYKKDVEKEVDRIRLKVRLRDGKREYLNDRS